LKTGQCRCRFPFFSPKVVGGACELKHCPGTRLAAVGANDKTRNLYAKDWIGCNGRGTCIHTMSPSPPAHTHDVTSGWCDCDVGFSGDACEKSLCPNAKGSVCGGQGSCDQATGLCSCLPDFFGVDCSQTHCPGYEAKSLTPLRRPETPDDFYQCHGDVKGARGTCHHNTGVCACTASYHGPRCEKVKCPKSTDGFVCNSEGDCDESTGVCKCIATHSGAACEVIQCPKLHGVICGGPSRGTCDGSKGVCTCASGYQGYNCGRQA